MGTKPILKNWLCPNTWKCYFIIHGFMGHSMVENFGLGTEFPWTFWEVF